MLITSLTHFSANNYLQLQRSHCCALLTRILYVNAMHDLADQQETESWDPVQYGSHRMKVCLKAIILTSHKMGFGTVSISTKK